ncbi:hypothetical protein NOC27_2882 [Nitrosococcus oceani AFC27]|nr:hypothetical protein NOC27_2882 [Nitrosococcus oceani AFC27]GEM21578.1 hypothetical protein NONS58_30230 [Nitrosococcus oceani]
MCEKEFRSAYRKSGDPKFLEAVLPNNKEKLEQIGEALKKLYLDNILDAQIEQTLAAITIYAEDIKDWCQRNHRPLPRFWFPLSEAAASHESGSYQPSPKKLIAEAEEVGKNLSGVLKASDKMPVDPPRKRSLIIPSTANQYNTKDKKSYLNIELVRRTYDHLCETQKDRHLAPKEELAFVINKPAHFDTDKIIELYLNL